MVLLLHWSMLNYAAVVKILKKHGELLFQDLSCLLLDDCPAHASSIHPSSPTSHTSLQKSTRRRAWIDRMGV